MGWTWVPVDHMAKPAGASPPSTWIGKSFIPNFGKNELSRNRSYVFNESLLKELTDRSVWVHARLGKSGTIDSLTRASNWEAANLPEELVKIISSCLRDDIIANEKIANAQRLQGVRVVNSAAVNSYMTVFSVDASLDVKTSKAIVDEISKNLFSVGNYNNYFRAPAEIRSVHVSADKGQTFLYLTTTNQIVAARGRAALQNILNGKKQHIRSLMATNSKSLVRAPCTLKGVSRNTPMVTLHAIVEPYGNIVNGSIRYLNDEISCTICVFENCEPLPSQLERVICRDKSNIPMLLKVRDVFLCRTPSQAVTMPVPDVTSVSQDITVDTVMPSTQDSAVSVDAVPQDSVSISQDTIPSVELPSSTSATNTPPQFTNVDNVTEVSNASEDPKASVDTFNLEKYYELALTEIPLDLMTSIGPIIQVPIDSPLTQSEVYELRAYELTAVEPEDFPLIEADTPTSRIEISRIQLKIFAHLQKRGLSWNDNYASELLRLGVLVSPSSSPPRKKLKTDDNHGSVS